jgi:hypothetical protein
MKKLLILLLTGLTFAADQISLDTQFIDANGQASSLYENPALAAHAGDLEPHWLREGSITVYVKIDELLGADTLKEGARYRVDEITWQGHPQNWFVGGCRHVRIANGREYADVYSIEKRGERKHGVICKEGDTPIYFDKDSILEVNLRWLDANPGGIYMRYFEAPEHARITGTAMNLTPEGKLAGGKAGENFYNKKWRYNSPAIRIKATAAEPDENTDLTNSLCLVLEGLAFAVLIILYLRARRRNS